MRRPGHSLIKRSRAAWIGNIPSHWSEVRLKFGLKLITEKASSDEPKVALENIESGTGRFVSSGTEYDGDGTAFVRGDILFGKLRPYLAKALLAEEDGQAIGDFHVLRPFPEVSGRFALYYVLSRNFISVVDGATYGAKMPRASWDFMSNLPLPLPPLPEQTAIAAFLDRETGKIDALVDEQRQLIELLKEKRQAVISHAVTKGLDPNVRMKPSGVEWLGDVPEHWDVGPLKGYWSVTDCKHITAEFVGDGIPLASIREAQSYFVDLSDAKLTTPDYFEILVEGGRRPRPGDLIFTRNATVGEVAQVAEWHPPFAMGQDVCLLRRIARAQVPDFLQFMLRSTSAVQQLDLSMVGATFKRVNVEAIRNMIFAWPPLGEQRAIADTLLESTASMDKLINAAEKAITLLVERRSSLISAAVTGKIDLRDFAAQEEAA